MNQYVKELLKIHDLPSLQIISLEEKLELIIKNKSDSINDIDELFIKLSYTNSITLDDVFSALKYCKYHFGAQRSGIDQAKCGCDCICDNCLNVSSQGIIDKIYVPDAVAHESDCGIFECPGCFNIQQ